VVTYFVLPVLAAERLGPIAAVRRSSAILRSKWGESLAGEARFGLIGLLFVVATLTADIDRTLDKVVLGWSE
jgi:hypothetical protein